MATFTLVNAIALGFPTGTKVKAYAQKGANVTTPASGIPPGTFLEEPEVNAEGTLVLANVAEATYYLLAAEVTGVWRYAKIYVQKSGEVVQIATQATGDFAVMTAGRGFRTKEGANAKQGIATLVAGTVTVADTAVTANSRIFLTGQSAGAGAATWGELVVSARTPATSFVITSSLATDTREVAYEIFEPA
jgi:hypothetical protein